MFSVGETVALKVDKSCVGVVIQVKEPVDGVRRYVVFHDASRAGEYYEDQLVYRGADDTDSTVIPEEFLCRYACTKLSLAESSSMFSLNAGNIKFIPYQFRPLKKIIRAERPRILIADEVGVGKTIEAGIILKEYEKREDVRSAAVVCPRELCSKWQHEMKNRFDETFLILDSASLDYCLREMELEGEWPIQFSKCIIGLEMIRRADTLQKVENLTDPIEFDMIVLDEAHHVVNEKSNSHEVAEYFCENSDVAVFLSATPIQLKSRDLYVLLNLLLPEDFCDEDSFGSMAEPNKYINAAIRCLRDSTEGGWQEQALANLKAVPTTNEWARGRFGQNRQLWYWIDRLSHLDNPLSDNERVECLRDLDDLNSFSHIINRTKRRDIGEFTLRDPVTVEVEFSPEEQAFYDQARELEFLIYEEQHGTQVAKMIMTTMERLMTSSLPAFVMLLKSMAEGKPLTQSAITDDLDVDDYAVDANGQIRAVANDLLVLASTLPEEDAKLNQLLQIIHETGEGPDGGKLLVFSFFKHTLRYLVKKIGNEGVRVALITGETPSDGRDILRSRFRLPKGDSRAIDVLLCSEVGCEGLDYEFCSRMVNYDIPWNPMKIEQRIGRIDRFGQKSQKVRIYNFVTAGTVEERIFFRCFERLGVFSSTIGDLEEVLGTVEKELTTAALDLTLSKRQQAIKAQQCIDNAIRDKEEQDEYESDARNLFLLDIARDDQKVDKERNAQIGLLERLVIGFLHREMDSFQFNEIAPHEFRIRAGKQDRSRIHKDLLALRKARKIDANSEQFKNLDGYLVGDSITATLYFDAEHSGAKEDILVTTAHPLVTLALEQTKILEDAPVALTCTSSGLPADAYDFGCFEWQERGYRSSNSIVFLAISKVSGRIVNADLSDFEQMLLSSDIEELDESHFDGTDLDVEMRRRQSCARERLSEVNADVVTRKLTTLDNSYKRKIARIEEASKSVTNPKIKLMRRHQIKNLEVSWEQSRRELSDKLQADILVKRLAHGTIEVI